MKKIMILSCLVTLNVSANFGFFKANNITESYDKVSKKDVQVYEQLHLLYESSSIPANFTGKENVEQIDPDYVGCVVADEDGTVRKSDDNFFIVKSKITLKEGYGPLFPSTTNFYYELLNFAWLEYYLRIGTSFRVGVLDYDGIRVSDEENEELNKICNDDGTTTIDTYKNISYRLSDDNTEMVTTISCNNSTNIVVTSSRFTDDNLLIARNIIKNADGSIERNYKYCW